MSTNAEIVKHHVESLVSGDVDEVMSDFSANAVILCGQQPIRGSEAMRAFFSDASASLDGFELDVSVGARDHHYIAWHTADGLRGTDTFHIRDGRIVLQTAFFMDQKQGLSAAKEVLAQPAFRPDDHLHLAGEN
jgi:limonene-1,2-epoxide hydrolase